MKKKGFTLIELLAVIIILGILMLIAIPSVTSYINNTRKQSYISTVKNLVDGSIMKVNSGDLCVTANSDTTYYIHPKCIDMETAYVSPYGNFEKSYVVVKYNDKKESFDYYWAGVDVAGIGVDSAVLASHLSDKNLKTNLVPNDVLVKPIKEGYYVVIDENCSCGEKTESDNYISGKCYNPDETSIQFTSNLDGLSVFYTGTRVVVNAHRIGLDNCEIKSWKWTYRLNDGERMPIEEMEGYIRHDFDTLEYYLSVTNHRYTKSYSIYTVDDD